ncbi:iron dicitrate transport regulator FecR [Burkholderia lata]|uniref:FecR domain-containing protein n=1 Tax=Burkholderia lata (strain ATCC 17760 / DSM 23089 / LMG 22485 / NCIMB 9086 / R18194 / 383) TaxID=482957 RepID=UPI001453D6F5|nr:FecR domain-containing protein [Burkholderia lata]VWB97410.1 iron dicitrate transport regulator FecR [Burkholderia lata]
MSGRQGEALPDAVVEQAIGWLARLWSGDATDDDRRRCAAWRAEHPDHERAWQRLAGIDAKLGSVPADTARDVLLAQPARPARRRAMRALGWAITFGGASYGVRSTRLWQSATSDYASGVGEVRDLMLADGTRVWLDTESAIDVRFDARERRIVLVRGAVHVETAHDAAGRPLRVEMRQGIARALGTRFTASDEGGCARVDVFDGAVEIRPARAADRVLRLEAGEAVRFDADGFAPREPADVRANAWTQGRLIAERMRVDAWCAELARYRPGVLRCDPALARLSVSGVFSLTDTDRALASLRTALPVEVVYRTRYWVTVVPR